MLSIVDVKDFIDLDHETVYAVRHAMGLPAGDSAVLAQQLLSTESGITILHHMFRDLIAASEVEFQSQHKKEIRRAYAHFSRKYPLPHILGDGA
ncbi:MAG: hypothetical protein PHV02_03955 [Rhodocyclaceae bacterium]|nr:hypothetical protein [Rhodocyclaceae bacterium]